MAMGCKKHWGKTGQVMPNPQAERSLLCTSSRRRQRDKQQPPSRNRHSNGQCHYQLGSCSLRFETPLPPLPQLNGSAWEQLPVQWGFPVTKRGSSPGSGPRPRHHPTPMGAGPKWCKFVLSLCVGANFTLVGIS